MKHYHASTIDEAELQAWYDARQFQDWYELDFDFDDADVDVLQAQKVLS